MVPLMETVNVFIFFVKVPLSRKIPAHDMHTAREGHWSFGLILIFNKNPEKSERGDYALPFDSRQQLSQTRNSKS